MGANRLFTKLVCIFPIDDFPCGGTEMALVQGDVVVENDLTVGATATRRPKVPWAMRLMNDFRCCLQYNTTFSRCCLRTHRKGRTGGHAVYVTKNAPFLRMFERLGIGHRVVELLYEYFQCIDRDGSGEIDLKEFFTFFQMKDTAFARRAFSVMDEDDAKQNRFISCLVKYNATIYVLSILERR